MPNINQLEKTQVFFYFATAKKVARFVSNRLLNLNFFVQVSVDRSASSIELKRRICKLAH
jgi:hypothetical protein